MRRITISMLILLTAGPVVACGESGTDPVRSARILSITPTTGPEAGGTVVTIDTFRFREDFRNKLPMVTFRGAPATDVVAVDRNTITATSPPGPLGGGVVDVQVVAQNGKAARLANAFVYTP